MATGSITGSFGMELLTILGIFGGIYLLSNENNGYGWLKFGKRNRIESIYQLLPILQKNVKVVFLLFSDFATAINSVRGQNNSPLSRDVIKSVLSQEHFSELLKNSQEQVLKEFNVDSIEMKKALQRFSHDDQVSMYNVGVNQMYSTVLDGGYPQCPGFDVPESLTRDCMLRLLEKVIIGKLTGNADEKVISEEMKRYGYDNTLDAMVAFKSAENSYSYDNTFIKERSKLTEKFKKVCSNETVQRVSAEELAILIDTMDNETSLYLAVFDDFVDPSFLDAMEKKVFSPKEHKAVQKGPAKERNGLNLQNVESQAEHPCNGNQTDHSCNGNSHVNGVHKTTEQSSEEESSTVETQGNENVCGYSDENDELKGEDSDDGAVGNAVTCWTFKCNLTPGINVSLFPAILCFRDHKVEKMYYDFENLCVATQAS